MSVMCSYLSAVGATCADDRQ